MFIFSSMAPWCPACRSFTETWKKFAELSNDLEISVGVVDVTENPGNIKYKGKQIKKKDTENV